MVVEPTNNNQLEWDTAYANKDNFLFYPHEEIVRFVSRFIRKKVGKDSFCDFGDASAIKVLDLGCGIGRHVVFCEELKLDAYGVDLSQEAIDYAKGWLRELGVRRVDEKLQQGDARRLPWEDDFFDVSLSHGVFDSMPYKIAASAAEELHRVMRPKGLFYCDLISGDDSEDSREFSGEEIVKTKHEEGTIQCYFNMAKVEKLFERFFVIEECQLIRHENVLTGTYHSRYSLVLSCL